jgi:hypothetical protein
MGAILTLLSPVFLIVRGFLTTNGFLAALIVGGGVAFLTYDSSRVKHGRILEAAAREKANADAVEIARRGANGTGSKRVLDPYTRSE